MNFWRWKNTFGLLNHKSYSQKPSQICSWATGSVLQKAFSSQDIADAVINCGSGDLCGCQGLSWGIQHSSSCAERLCRHSVPQALLTAAMQDIAPVWRNSLLSKSSGSASCPKSLLPMLGAACRSCRQERALTSLSLWKLSSLRFKLPFSLTFPGPSGSAPADRQHNHGDSSISEASICRGFECASWLQSKCQPAWEGFQPQTSSGQMAKVFFQPGESWLCETYPVKPTHMVALAAEDFMCIICLPALLSVTAGRSL